MLTGWEGAGLQLPKAKVIVMDHFRHPQPCCAGSGREV